MALGARFCLKFALHNLTIYWYFTIVKTVRNIKVTGTSMRNVIPSRQTTDVLITVLNRRTNRRNLKEANKVFGITRRSPSRCDTFFHDYQLHLYFTHGRGAYAAQLLLAKSHSKNAQPRDRSRLIYRLVGVGSSAWIMPHTRSESRSLSLSFSHSLLLPLTDGHLHSPSLSPFSCSLVTSARRPGLSADKCTTGRRKRKSRKHVGLFGLSGTRERARETRSKTSKSPWTHIRSVTGWKERGPKSP